MIFKINSQIIGINLVRDKKNIKKKFCIDFTIKAKEVKLN